MTEEKPKTKRGFASMTPEQRKAIASKGGKAAHEQGTAHRWTREQAIEAGRKGGKACMEKHPEHQSQIGQIGGKRRHEATCGSVDSSPAENPST